MTPLRMAKITRDGREVIGLAECCHRIGISVRTGEKLIADGRFPIPELPRITRTHRFAAREIDLYLEHASVEDAKVARR
jgi:predicted DNA-binding transcriptional regulator AlpA